MWQRGLIMQSPWITYNDYLTAIFEGDSEVTVSKGEFDADGKTFVISVLCSNNDKTDALNKILKKNVAMGNISVRVDVNCNVNQEPSESVFDIAFKGNPHYSRSVTLETPFHTQETYVIMNKEVIQFYNDDISDPWGNYNGLAEDILREITDTPSTISYCTEALEPNQE